MKLISRQNVTAERPQDLVIRCTGQDALVQAVPVSVTMLFKDTLPVARMRESVPALLNLYPLFASRLGFSDERLHIDCRSGCIPFELVARNDTLDQALARFGSKDTQTCEIRINARAALKRGAPVAALRISYFKGGGTCVSLGFHHSLGDFHTVVAFLRAWADIASGRPAEAPALAADRADFIARTVKDNGMQRVGVRRVDAAELPRLLLVLARNRWDTKQATFYFSDDELERMRKDLSERAGQYLTANDAVSGHVFSSVVAASPSRGERRLAFVVNWRKRMGVPGNVLGNLMSTLNLSVHGDTSPAGTAATLRRAIDSYGDEHMDYFCNERFIDGHGGHTKAGRILPNGIDPVRRTLLLSNVKRSGLYDVDFCGSRPLYHGPMNAAMPYLSCLSEGFNNQGSLFMAFVPACVHKALVSEPVVRQLHRYRAPDEARPELVERLKWVH